MTLPVWLRIFIHPIILWILAQGIALYFFFSFTPVPQKAFQRWFLSAQSIAHDIGAKLTAPWRALRRVRELEALTAELQARLSTRPENTIASPLPLGSVGDFSALHSYRFLPAEVIYRSFLLRENYALLNKGARDGVYPGLGVVSPQGVVGIIAETTATYSVMYAIFHKDVHLAASLPRQEVIGVTSWSVPTLNRILLEYIPLYIQVEPGEEVWTASNSQIFPPGLRIGRVRSVRSDFMRGFHAIEVDTHAEWGRLSGVFILIPSR